MRRLRFLRTKKGLFASAGVAALVVASVLWLERTPLLAWYYLRGLAAADEANRETWVERVVHLGEDAVPGLLDCLGRDSERACANAHAALDCLLGRWGGAEDPRRAALADRLAEAFLTRSLPGQLTILEVSARLTTPEKTQKPPPAAIVRAAGRVLGLAVPLQEAGVRCRALALANVLVDLNPPGEVLDAAYALARAGLTAPDPATRTRAVNLTRSRALRSKTDLAELVLPLLRDPSAEVRREALRAVGLNDKLISDEDLLTWLHDSDREVQRLCENALRCRGRSEMDIRLGRCITDDRARERLKIFSCLSAVPDRDLSDLLRRLTEDAEPAVRIAAAMAAERFPVVDLADRLRDMAQNDRSPTVRQVVEYCVRARQKACKEMTRNPSE
jgi:hypothetical protein